VTKNETTGRFEIEDYLKTKGHTSVTVNPGFSGIEDVFIELMTR
jgi:hypothetical protein